MNPTIKDAELLQQTGHPLRAYMLCRKILKRQPQDVPALVLMSQLAANDGRITEAIRILRAGLNFDSTSSAIANALFNLLASKEQYSEIITDYLKLTPQQKISSDVLLCAGFAQERKGDFKGAINKYIQVVDNEPEHGRALMSLGHAYRYSGESAKSIDCYRKSIDIETEYITNAFWSLSNLKIYHFQDIEILKMQQLLADQNVTAGQQAFLGFALGKAFEDLEQYEESFRYYQLGNDAKREKISFNKKMHREYTLALVQCFSESILSKTFNDGDDATVPIFIIGMPRSGSTLIEQILSSHSMVERLGELPYINRILWDMESKSKGVRYPLLVQHLTAQKIKHYRQYYLTASASHRKTTCKYFIDKNPNNFENIGIIKLLFPEAIIIDTRRDIKANAFSLYKQLFIRGQEFSYSLDDIQSYYSDYIYLMNYWGKLYPQEIITIVYENLVDDFEQSVISLLKHCSIPFEDSCLNFHKNTQSVDTASSEQVRSPIYKDAKLAWKHYEIHFQGFDVDLF